jgi:hypothetical protein
VSQWDPRRGPRTARRQRRRRDCCSSRCQFESSGSICAAMRIRAPTRLQRRRRLCAPIHSAPCDARDACTVGDVCAAAPAPPVQLQTPTRVGRRRSASARGPRPGVLHPHWGVRTNRCYLESVPPVPRAIRRSPKRWWTWLRESPRVARGGDDTSSRLRRRGDGGDADGTVQEACTGRCVHRGADMLAALRRRCWRARMRTRSRVCQRPVQPL